MEKVEKVDADIEKGMTTSMDMNRLQKIDENFTYPGGPLWNGVKLVEDKPVI